MSVASWIGVDLDGTLAHYEGWKGVNNIGAPVESVVTRIKQILEAGYKVKIFTARVSGQDSEAARAVIERWLVAVAMLPNLEITCVKDFGMVELWDDRCVAVEPNTGRFLSPSSLIR